MVDKKNLLLCIRSKPLRTKLAEALGPAFNLTFKTELEALFNEIRPNTSFCIIDGGAFRKGGKEFLRRTWEHAPHIGRSIIAKRMTSKEIREAINYCHTYAIWDTSMPPEDLVQTVHETIRERELKLGNMTRENELEILKNEKENLIDAFNHEVRSAIAPIRLSLRTLKQEIVSEKSLKVFQRIDNKVLRLSKIMERLLNFQSLEKGKYFFQVTAVNISEAIEEIMNAALFFIREEERIVDLTSDIPPGLTIIFDELMFSLILEEVLQNAVKYTTDNSRIHVSLQENESHLRIIVEDKGIGLNHDDLESVWNIGYENLETNNRSSGYYKFRSSGVGLGLSLVKKHLTMLGGDCTVESDGRCPAVPICVPGECPLTGAEGNLCEKMVRVDCRYICPGDTKQCQIIERGLGSGWCPGSRVTITLPR